MKVDLSFWEPPDWKREASISPVFLGAVAVVVILLAAGVYVMNLYNQLDSIKSDTAAIQSYLDENKVEVERYRKKQQLVQLYEASVRKPLHWKNQNRQLMSQLLMDLIGAVPDNVTLSVLSISSEQKSFSKNEKAEAKKYSSNKERMHQPMFYRLQLEGQAFGKTQQEVMLVTISQHFRPALERVLGVETVLNPGEPLEVDGRESQKFSLTLELPII